MKVKYVLADGRTVEVEVTEEVARALVDHRRADESAARVSRRHNEASLDEFRDEYDWEPADLTKCVETQVIQRERASALWSAIAGLTEKQRELVIMYYFEDKTERQIASLLGINRSNVNRRLETIKKSLRNFLE
jgi:RNA polymerase sigma factor (sigma-70 family)